MEPGNCHTPIAYNKTNKIKKFLQTLTKIHQEHPETSIKDIIKRENYIWSIDTELAKQAKKICEQVKSFEKINSSVKELRWVVDGLADNESPWFIVGKSGKPRNLMSLL